MIIKIMRATPPTAPPTIAGRLVLFLEVGLNYIVRQHVYIRITNTHFVSAAITVTSEPGANLQRAQYVAHPLREIPYVYVLELPSGSTTTDVIVAVAVF